MIAKPVAGQQQAAGTDAPAKNPPRRGAAIYFCAAILSQASGLLRYVVLARILGPQQLGFAAALTVTGSFFELASDTGSDRFLIQDRDGDEPAVQRLVQLIYAIRGLMVAVLLAASAKPVARLYGTPDLSYGLTVLALSPLIGGFLHLDMRRAQRHHDFRAEAVCNGAADTAGLIGAVGAAWFVRDYSAVAYGFIARSVVLVISSHLLAQLPYRIGWDRLHAPRLAQFAGPLLLNGITLFVVSQGDRVIIGHQMGLISLGYYTAILLLIFYPSNVLSNYVHAIFIPRIAAQRDLPAKRNCVGDELGNLTLLLALAMASGFVLVAPLAVPILYGTRFSQTVLFVGLVGVLQVTRFFLTWPTTVALAIGRSKIVLLSNLCHFAILPGAILGVRLIGGLGGVLAGFLTAELFAACIAIGLLNQITGRSPATGFKRLFRLLVGGTLILGFGNAIDSGRWLFAFMLLFAVFSLILWLIREDQFIMSGCGAITQGLKARLSGLAARLRLKHFP